MTTRLLLALLLGALLGLSAIGCGATGNAGKPSSTVSSHSDAKTETGSITTSAIPPGQSVRGDGDADNPEDIDGNGDSDSASVGGPDNDNDSPTPQSYDFPDEDDKSTFAYGRKPNGVLGNAIASTIKRYYAAASAEDGAAACSLLLPSFAGAVPEDYGQTGGPSYLRGNKTCQAVLSTLFRHLHAQLAEAIKVVEVRVKGGTAQVVFSSRSMPASHIFLLREGNSWKVSALLGQPLP
ncbi:MAG: hypothetical protein WBQ21_10790 [Solirubrobacteraceae bacterium]